MTPEFLTDRNREHYQNRVEKAIQFMSSHLAEDVNLEATARAAGFSPFHFHRLFTAITGETPQDFLIRLRMEKAANILVKSPAMSITEIAFACGYSSTSAFGRSFKRFYGIPAGEYARIRKAQNFPQSWVAAKPKTSEPKFELPEVTIKPMPALHLAVFKSHSGYSPAGIKSAWERVFHWAQGRGIPIPTTGLIAISYDDPEITEMKHCRYYACLNVPETIRHDTRAGIIDIPAHRAAVCRLSCQADQIMPAYRVIYRDWLPQSGFLITDLPPYEVYYDAPDVNPASKYVFDLCIPVEPL